MKQTYSPETKFVIYLGVNKLRDNEEWKMHGLTFEKGFVYRVTPEVAEYVKPIRNFMVVRGMKDGVIGFPK
jgi:hypothetical protein